MTKSYDLAIVGAGPAGLAAAASAAKLGVATVVLDEQWTPGGQIYRAVEHSPLATPKALGKEYLAGRLLTKEFRGQKLDYLPSSTVWHVGEDREIGILRNGKTSFIQASRIILATGALERPVPIPGWTLPGVMSVGGAQTLLKQAGVVPGGPVVLAGCGPLLFLVAWQYLRLGVEVRALLETTPRSNYLAAMHLLPAALRAVGYLQHGVRMIRAIIKAKVPIVRNVTGLRAVGTEHLQAVEYLRDGSRQSITAHLLLLHQGVIPNVQITRTLGCKHTWDTTQSCWRPELDDWGNTSRDGIAVAGDGGRIIGAVASEYSGRLAALHAAHQLGTIDEQRRDRESADIRQEMQRHLRIRPFLDTLYQPPQSIRELDDATMVCRCEEITAGEIRAATRLGCSGSNQIKSFTRCGMGPCQGRMCGPTVAAIIAEEGGIEISEVDPYRARPPIKPITLGQLAQADPSLRE